MADKKVVDINTGKKDEEVINPMDMITSLKDEEKNALCDYIDAVIKTEISSYHKMNVDILKSIDDILQGYDETIDNLCLDVITLITIICANENDSKKYDELKAQIKEKLEADIAAEANEEVNEDDGEE